MPDTPRPCDNHILARLDSPALERIGESMESAWVPFGQTIQETRQPLKHVYFPAGAVFALARYAENGDMAEVALTGNEGAVGVAAVLGDGASSTDAISKRAGHVFRVEVERLLEETRRNQHLLSALLEYSQALVAQLAQTSICNRLHNIDQRLARCLLQLRDRQDSDDLEITQEFLSHILGIRRVGVTRAAGLLQSADAIALMRGVIQIRDRAQLERHSCECYRIIREETERLSPSPGGDQSVQ